MALVAASDRSAVVHSGLFVGCVYLLVVVMNSPWKWVRHCSGLWACRCVRAGEVVLAVGVVDDFGQIILIG